MGMPIITPGNTTKCGALSDILESIALMETALSHILNAEGEKIQGILGTLPGQTPITTIPSSEELIAINQSVDNMVCSITVLECLLQKKLNQVLSVDCPTGSTGGTAS